MQRQASRRSFLAGVVAAVATARAGSAPGAVRQRAWVDVHHHFIPRGYREFFENARNADGSSAIVPPTSWTVAADLSVVFGGVTTRFQVIRFVFSHGGSTMPYLIERFLGGTAAEIVPGVLTNGQDGPYVPKQPEGGALAHLRRLHYDTAQCANPVAMRALHSVVGASPIVFGTDYFYRTATESVRGLETCGAFSRVELDAIARGNAVHLLRIPKVGQR